VALDDFLQLRCAASSWACRVVARS
jgi:hypothetical protein